MSNIAKKYRVPTQKTCEALAWETPTNYLWAMHPTNGYELHFVMQETENGFKTAICGSRLTDFVEREKVIFAPQFDEIMEALPECVSVGGHQFHFESRKTCVCYIHDLNCGEDFTSQDALIFDMHSASPTREHPVEAIATLALFIKENGFELVKINP